MHNPTNCVLCGFTPPRLDRTLSTLDLVKAWRETWGIDIGSEFGGHDRIRQYECPRCHLQFFEPSCAGSGSLYSQLQTRDWYYMADKWEHSAALEDMRKGDRVLEIGCGTGHFIRRMLKNGIAANGIELNERAAQQARQAGLPVECRTLAEMVQLHAASFDVVCSFQVLEHVPDPAAFLKECVALLKPSGRLLIGVPNNDSFIRLEANNLLNQPPHHVTRWSRSTFEAMGKLLGLRFVKIRNERLATYHAMWYANLQMERLPQVPIATMLGKSFVRKAVVPLARFLGLHNLFRGHSLYAVFEKPAANA